MGQVKVFLDSDVLVSALLSKTGASFKILQNSKITKIISKTIKKEIIDVATRSNINLPSKDIFQSLKIITLKLEKPRLSQRYFPYVLDQEDSHVLAGAHKTKVKFLLTHNLKHYQVAKIRNDFGVSVMKPGLFLQYLRSLGI
ncbi:MAG: PIN domain-containing protein [Candidatus Chisholmbacteria bacterium]|nr:PIN domain-containing protein [Candidatus Chisholmbacteria bacterium]